MRPVAAGEPRWPSSARLGPTGERTDGTGGQRSTPHRQPHQIPAHRSRPKFGGFRPTRMRCLSPLRGERRSVARGWARTTGWELTAHLHPGRVAAWKPSPASCLQHRGREGTGDFSPATPAPRRSARFSRAPPSCRFARFPPSGTARPPILGDSGLWRSVLRKRLFCGQIPGSKGEGAGGMAAEGTARTRGAMGGVQCLSPLRGERRSVAQGWARTTRWELMGRLHPRQGWLRGNRRRRAASSTGAGSGSGSGDFSPAAPAPPADPRGSHGCRPPADPYGSPARRPPPELRG